MLPKHDKQYIRDSLGIEADAAEWCFIEEIPQPPDEVWTAAGKGPLRPGRRTPLGMLGVAAGFPFKIFIPVIWMLEKLNDLIYGDRTAQRAERNAQVMLERANAEHGMDQVFDGDWNRAAGQFLLRWYTQSTHPWRLVIMAPGRVVLAGPPRRVTFSALQKTEVVAELPAAEATLEDPLLGAHKTDRLRLAFADGSWLTLVGGGGEPTDIHWPLWGKEAPPEEATGRRRLEL